MNLLRFLNQRARAVFLIGFVAVGLVSVQAQKPSAGGGKADPAQKLQRLQELGKDPGKLMQRLEAGAGKADPVQKLERLQQQGKDPSKLLDRAQQAGIDTSKLQNRLAQANSADTAGIDRIAQVRLNPNQVLDHAVDSFQDQLELSDAEWAVVRPLVKDVIVKQNALLTETASVGVVASLGSARGAGVLAAAPARIQHASDSTPEAAALRGAIESGVASQDLKPKLVEFRSARTKQEAELKTARENLRKVLSLRREAEAVLAGLLD